MTKLLQRLAPVFVLLLLAAPLRGDIVLSVVQSSVDALGADLLVNATPTPAVDLSIGTFGVALQLHNFVGISGSVNFDQSDPLPPMGELGPTFGTTPDGSAVDGDVIRYVALGLATVPSTGANLYQVRVDVPGGFDLGESFRVDVLPTDNGFTTAVGNATISSFVGTTVNAIPEPSAFLLVGLTLGGVAGVTFVRRLRGR
jgi:hypothetical protein